MAIFCFKEFLILFSFQFFDLRIHHLYFITNAVFDFPLRLHLFFFVKLYPKKSCDFIRIRTFCYSVLSYLWMNLFEMPINIDRNLSEPLKGLEWMAKQAVEGFITGLHKSPFHGFSVEFAEHRLYNTGDSLKHLDWKLLARTDKMFLKRYEEETNLRCHVLLDISESMLFPENTKGLNKLSFSVYSAAILFELFKRQRDAVGLCMFDDHLVFQSKASGSPAHLERLYAELENTLDKKSNHNNPVKTKMTDVLHQMAEEMPRRSLIVIFSDMLDFGSDKEAVFSALQHLRFNKHEVVIFHVVENDSEAMLNLENRPHTFIDPETLQEIKVNPVNIQSAYQEKWAQWRAEWSLKCNQFQIDWMDVNISEGFQNVMQTYMLKRQKMGKL